MLIFAARVLCIGSLFVAPGFSQTQTAPPAQASPSPSPSPAAAKPEKPQDKIEQKTLQEAGTPAKPASVGGGLEILSDTMGVDFGPYLKELKETVQKHWYSVMPRSAMAPEMKSGKTVVKFAVMRDGTLANLKIEQSSGDQALDRAAYGALFNSSPLAPLPPGFTGNYLLVRANFFYNPAKAQSKPEEKKDSDADKVQGNPPKDSPHL
jgi:TonB family protein